MTFEAYAREWLERQNFIKSTRKWTRQGLEIYTFPVIGGKEITEVTEEDIDRIFRQETECKIIGSRHGEKLYETLVTREEMLRSVDVGHYYRIAPDARGLNYDKFYVQGTVHTEGDEAYTSHNTNRLDVDGVVRKIMGTDYVQEELEGRPHAVEA